MKLGRNEPCPCGSGKKHKRCCMDSVSKQHVNVIDDIEQAVTMNPNLTFDELNVVAQRKIQHGNECPNDDFYGLTPTQMSRWLYGSFNEWAEVNVSAPSDLTSSPVMRYLELIVDEAMEQGGSFKATTKGNLPAKLVKKASDLLPEFAVAEYEQNISISEYMGSNEDKFNALHYTRILAEVTGIIYLRSGRFHIKKDMQKQYRAHGINTFFLPMLEAAVSQYNWGYFDSWEQGEDLGIFWLFMLWRLQNHSDIEQLVKEVELAFPKLLLQFTPEEYATPTQLLGILIESRFLERFLQFWGFITVDPKRFKDGKYVSRKVEVQPLLKQTFQFAI